jgi:hypothetical protein
MTETIPDGHHRETQHSHKRRGFVSRLKLVAIITLVGATTTFGFLYFRSRAQLRSAGQNSAAGAIEEANALVKKIGEHMVLPSERPTIATVDNTKKLADQAFFKHARNGDKVLIFTQNKKAILYRPSENKVIEVAYLNIKK